MDNKFLGAVGLTRLIALTKKQILDDITSGSKTMTYTNADETTATVGGIAQGTTFADGVNIYSLITSMLYPKEDTTAKLIADLQSTVSTLSSTVASLQSQITTLETELKQKDTEQDSRIDILEQDVEFKASADDTNETVSLESTAGASVTEETLNLDSKLVSVNDETLEISES